LYFAGGVVGGGVDDSVGVFGGGAAVGVVVVEAGAFRAVRERRGGGAGSAWFGEGGQPVRCVVAVGYGAERVNGGEDVGGVVVGDRGRDPAAGFAGGTVLGVPGVGGGPGRVGPGGEVAGGVVDVGDAGRGDAGGSVADPGEAVVGVVGVGRGLVLAVLAGGDASGGVVGVGDGAQRRRPGDGYRVSGGVVGVGGGVVLTVGGPAEGSGFGPAGGAGCVVLVEALRGAAEAVGGEDFGGFFGVGVVLDGADLAFAAGGGGGAVIQPRVPGGGGVGEGGLASSDPGATGGGGGDFGQAIVRVERRRGALPESVDRGEPVVVPVEGDVAGVPVRIGDGQDPGPESTVIQTVPSYGVTGAYGRSPESIRRSKLLPRL
jgi:hypothetical protein